nr:unnamed protein product [Callosobruchus chinensis]
MIDSKEVRIGKDNMDSLPCGYMEKVYYFFDLTRAFEKLVGGIPNKWIASYLKNRKQTVDINNVRSESKVVQARIT